MTTRLINEFINNVVYESNISNNDAMKSVFGTDNVRALLADIHNDRVAQTRETLGNGAGGPLVPLHDRPNAVDAAVGQAGDVGSKLGIPPDQLAKLITDPKFAEHLTRIKNLRKKTTPIRGITKADIR